MSRKLEEIRSSGVGIDDVGILFRAITVDFLTEFSGKGREMIVRACGLGIVQELWVVDEDMGWIRVFVAEAAGLSVGWYCVGRFCDVHILVLRFSEASFPVNQGAHLLIPSRLVGHLRLDKLKQRL